MGLYTLDCTEGETEILRMVKVVPTTQADEVEVVPWSLLFLAFRDFEAVLDFWTARCLVLTICRAICESPGTTFRVSKPKLDAELDRMIKNMMMCWQYAFSLRPYTSTFLPMSLAAMGAALLGPSKTRCGHPAAEVRELVSRRRKRAAEMWHMKSSLAVQFYSSAIAVAGRALPGDMFVMSDGYGGK